MPLGGKKNFKKFRKDWKNKIFTAIEALNELGPEEVEANIDFEALNFTQLADKVRD